MSVVTRKTSELLAGVRLVIFDADDTLRRTTVPGQPCPHHDDEWELMPMVRERLSTIDWREGNVTVGVASNQDHVGYGLVDSASVDRMLRSMIDRATDGAVRYPEIRFCPHRLDVECGCRKPEPGMLLDIMHSRSIPPHATLFIGNSLTDAEAARRARVRFLWAQEFFASGTFLARSG
jgi:D-glycero-D-manno-heptose 1,7-bisphosphate phosphatase